MLMTFGVPITQCLFWSMLEAGLAIIAACLPTLGFLFGKAETKTILRSMRGALSVDHVRSQRLGSSDSRKRSYGLPRGPSIVDGASISSHEVVTASCTSGNEEPGIIMQFIRDLEAQRSPPEGHILVQKDIRVSKETFH